MSGSSQGECMEQISWSEQVVEYFNQAYLGVFENKRMILYNSQRALKGEHGDPLGQWPNRFLLNGSNRENINYRLEFDESIYFRSKFSQVWGREIY